MDNRAGNVIEGLRPACAQIENAGHAGVVKEPQVHRYHVVNKDEVTHLCSCGIAAVVSKQLDLALSPKLVKLMKGDAGHAAFVLLVRPIDIEVAKTHHLARLAGYRAPKVVAALTPHTLIKQQLGIAINIQRTLKGWVFPERVRATVRSGA